MAYNLKFNESNLKWMIFTANSQCVSYMQRFCVGVWVKQKFLSPLSENTLFGMGNPLLDISAVVDKDFLDK